MLHAGRRQASIPARSTSAVAAFPPGRRTAGEHLCPLGDNRRVSSSLDPAIAARLKRDEHGLFPAVAQQHDSGEVLMVGWMDDEALHRTLTTGRATYWSRSRREYWVKGETSGHRQRVVEVRLDCDGDTVLVKVDQEGPACHTGARTCFDADLLTDG
jgi:phosphoribosyl-AMP cyclohydrolase